MELARRKIWIDGELVPWERATVHVLSQSLQRGSLVFDVMSVHSLAGEPAVFGLRAHARRFQNSARLSGMTLPRDLDGIVAGIGETVRGNPGAEVVKVSAYYPGVSLDVLPRDRTATLAIAALAPSDVHPGVVEPAARRPAELQIADARKLPPWTMSPQAKLAAGYLYTAVAKAAARDAGFDDVLLLDERGNVAESSTQSFFLVEQGVLSTAPLDYVLAGITRRALLELARDEGMTVKEEPIPRDDLERASEAFLAGTTVNVWPVGRVDDVRLPAPVPGPTTARLAARLQRLLAGEDPVFSPRWMQKV